MAPYPIGSVDLPIVNRFQERLQHAMAQSRLVALTNPEGSKVGILLDPDRPPLPEFACSLLIKG